jgi:uncharacterized protein (DUF433 family)
MATAPGPFLSEYLAIIPGYCGGEPHILGHRIKVRHVAVWHEHHGMSPAEIVGDYPTITLGQVHAALAYYYDHREEIERAIVEADEFVEGLKAKEGASLPGRREHGRSIASNWTPD